MQPLRAPARMQVPEPWTQFWENMHSTDQHREKSRRTTRTGGTALDVSLHLKSGDPRGTALDLFSHVHSGDPRGIRRGSKGIRGPNRGSGLFRPYVSWGILRPQSGLL